MFVAVQTLHDLQLGGADDEGSMEAALNTISAKDTAFTTNPSALSHAPSRVPSGHIRQVRPGQTGKVAQVAAQATNSSCQLQQKVYQDHSHVWLLSRLFS